MTSYGTVTYDRYYHDIEEDVYSVSSFEKQSLLIEQLPYEDQQSNLQDYLKYSKRLLVIMGSFFLFLVLLFVYNMSAG